MAAEEDGGMPEESMDVMPDNGMDGVMTGEETVEVVG